MTDGFSPDKNSPTQGIGVMKSTQEGRALPVPPGTLIFDVARYQKEGFRNIGVSRMRVGTLHQGDIRNYYPRKDWDVIPEGTPVTVIIMTGMRSEKRLVIENTSLTAQEINKIIDLVVRAYLLYEYHMFSKKVALEVKELHESGQNDLSYTLKSLRNTQEAHPTILAGDSVLLDIETQLEELGVLTERISGSSETIAAKIDEIIEQLNDLKLLSSEDVARPGMWWPIKKFIDKPYSAIQEGSTNQ